ncbi:hypothetical protein DLAC_09791 [Tieghemostelium lacteum]|uniref:Leucine-rich repeat-containing protein (LRR) n=1 Tax=Tieghemostelium lacteum TaxID=361077 RepID=A0A151Z7A9_TIELA|nr:hypothetical protein DLAC_09791 [Tieghemostelium lacteum]|eukprot:KYQ89818.1 hypothetical protein DLAC_09791 [Tieghemostelium lacteum]
MISYLNNINKLPIIIIKEIFNLIINECVPSNIRIYNEHKCWPISIKENSSGSERGSNSTGTLNNDYIVGLIDNGNHGSFYNTCIGRSGGNGSCSSVVLKEIVVLLNVCKQWRSIMYNNRLHYAHIGSIDDFKLLIHLHKLYSLKFEYLNFHVKSSGVSGSPLDEENLYRMYLKFFQRYTGSSIIKIHELSNNMLQSDILEIMIENGSQVKELHLIGKVPYTPSVLPNSLFHRKKLKSIIIEKGLVDSSSPQILNHLLECSSRTSLTSLGLLNNQCNGITVNILSRILKSNKTIKYLNLENNFINDGAEISSFFQSLSSDTCVLEYLNMRSNIIGNQSINILTKTLKCRNSFSRHLEYLDISNNRISDDSACSLIKVILLKTRISTLKLSHNYLGIGFIHTLRHHINNENSQLRSLDISKNNFKKASWDLVNLILMNQSLLEIDISQCQTKPKPLYYLIHHLYKNSFNHSIQKLLITPLNKLPQYIITEIDKISNRSDTKILYT